MVPIEDICSSNLPSVKLWHVAVVLSPRHPPPATCRPHPARSHFDGLQLTPAFRSKLLIDQKLWTGSAESSNERQKERAEVLLENFRLMSSLLALHALDSTGSEFLGNRVEPEATRFSPYFLGTSNMLIKKRQERWINCISFRIFFPNLFGRSLVNKLQRLGSAFYKCKTGLGYNAVPPLYTGNFMPPELDLVYPSLDNFVDVNESISESIVEKPTVESNEPKTARK
ncbi:hypothetical protein Tco_0016658 [Tanacetum coccineum]